VLSMPRQRRWLLFGQWQGRGYKAIGTTSSQRGGPRKKNGYKWVIDYTKEDVVAAVRRSPRARACRRVDGVGKDTWAACSTLQARLMVSSAMPRARARSPSAS